MTDFRKIFIDTAPIYILLTELQKITELIYNFCIIHDII